MEMKKTLLVAAISGAAGGALKFALPLFLDHQGYGLSEIGWVFGIAALFSGILGIGIGALSDKFGRKPLIAFYNLLRGLSAFIIGWIPGVYAFIAGKSLDDFSKVHLWGAFVSRVRDVTGNEVRGRAIGKFIAVFGTTFSLALVFSGYIIDNFGYHVLFSVIILVSIIAAGFTFLFREKGKRKEEVSFSLELLKTMNGKVNSAISFFTGFSDALIYAYFFYIFLIKQYSFSIFDVGFITAGLFLLWSLGSYFSGKIVDKHGIRKSIAGSALAGAVVWVGVLFFWADFWPFIFLIAMENILWSLYSTGATTLSSVIPKQENIGRDVSVFSYSHIIGAIAGAFIAGMLADISYSYLFIVKVVSLLVPAFLVWYGIKLKQ